MAAGGFTIGHVVSNRANATHGKPGLSLARFGDNQNTSIPYGRGLVAHALIVEQGAADDLERGGGITD